MDSSELKFITLKRQMKAFDFTSNYQLKVDLKAKLEAHPYWLIKGTTALHINKVDWPDTTYSLEAVGKLVDLSLMFRDKLHRKEIDLPHLCDLKQITKSQFEFFWNLIPQHKEIC